MTRAIRRGDDLMRDDDFSPRLAALSKPGKGPKVTDDFKRRTPSRWGEGGALREEILEAATRLLTRSRREGDLSLRAVAREVGISAPSIYLHFKDRADLVAAVVERAYERLLEELRESRKDAGADPRAALRAMAHRYCHFASDHPQHYRLMFGIERVPAAREATPRHPAFLMADIWTEAVSTCRREHADGPDDASVGKLLWSSLHGVVGIAMSMPFKADRQGLDELADDLLDLPMPE